MLEQQSTLREHAIRTYPVVVSEAPLLPEHIALIAEHAGVQYFSGDGEPVVTYESDRSRQHGAIVDLCYTLEGAHQGPPIKVWLSDVHEESNDDGPGYSVTWLKMLWADDDSDVESAYLQDGYGDVLMEDVHDLWRY